MSIGYWKFVGGGGGTQMQQQISGQIQHRTQMAVDEASKDPQQALSDAMALPLSDPGGFGLATDFQHWRRSRGKTLRKSKAGQGGAG